MAQSTATRTPPRTVPAAVTPAAPICEPVPVDVGEILISPRVIDQVAFTQFSAALRQLITEAAEHSRGLAAAAEGARTLLTDLGAAASKHRPHLNTAERLVTSLELRVKDARTLLDRAKDVSGELAGFRTESTAIAEESLAAFRAELERVLSAAAARAREVEERAAARISELERTLEVRERRIAERMEALERGAAAMGSEADRKPDDARAAVSAVSTGSGTTVERLSGELAAHEAELSARVGAAKEMLQGICDRAAGLIDRADRAENGTLGEAIRRAEELAEAATLASARFDAIREQTDVARRLLGESLLESTRAIDRIADCAASLTEEARRAEERMLAARARN